MTRWTRRAARITGTLLAVGILLAPSQAVADGIEPKPVDWPTVQAPDAQGEATEPKPVEWPAPQEP